MSLCWQACDGFFCCCYLFCEGFFVFFWPYVDALLFIAVDLVFCSELFAPTTHSARLHVKLHLLQKCLYPLNTSISISNSYWSLHFNISINCMESVWAHTSAKDHGSSYLVKTNPIPNFSASFCVWNHLRLQILYSLIDNINLHMPDLWHHDLYIVPWEINGKLRKGRRINSWILPLSRSTAKANRV